MSVPNTGGSTVKRMPQLKGPKRIFLTTVFLWIGANVVIDLVALSLNNLGDTEHHAPLHVSAGSLLHKGTIVSAPLAFVLVVVLLSGLVSLQSKWATRTGTVVLVLWMLLI